MIERTAFAKIMGVFADRIGRALAPATAEAYYDALSDQLTTDQFLAGARIVFRSHQFNTWPAPQQFIDAAQPRPAAALAAAEAFELSLEIMGDSRVPILERKARVLSLGPTAARAFIAAGGIREFNLLPLDQVPWLRKRFVEAWQDAASEEARRADALRALDHGALDPRAAHLVSATTHALSVGRDRAMPTGDT